MLPIFLPRGAQTADARAVISGGSKSLSLAFSLALADSFARTGSRRPSYSIHTSGGQSMRAEQDLIFPAQQRAHTVALPLVDLERRH